MEDKIIYNVKSPVVYLVYKRLDLVKKVFEVISSQKPSVLYIFSDGPRSHSDEDSVNEVRKYITESVNWECKLYLHFLDTNYGVYRVWDYIIDLVFATEERMIYLQEDLLPSVSFFQYCDELLDFYNNDESIYMIAGTNHLGVYHELKGLSYFFLPRTTTLGFAIWKRTYNLFLKKSESINHPYYLKIIEDKLKSKQKNHWFEELIRFINANGNIPNKGEEFDLMGINPNLLHGKFVIAPSVNLIKDIGYHNGSEHSGNYKTLPKSMRYSYNYKNNEIIFPLEHPKFKIVDDLYYRILSSNYPKPKGFHRNLVFVERVARVLLFGGFKFFKDKVKRRIRNFKIR